MDPQPSFVIVFVLLGAVLGGILWAPLGETLAINTIMKECVASNTFTYSQDIKFSCTLLPKK